MARVSGKIRRLLIDAGLVTVEEWTEARDASGPILENLLSQGVLEESDYLATLGQAAGVPPVELSRVRPDPLAMELLPVETCEEHGILPLTRNGDVLTIAVSDPYDVLLLDDLRRMTGCQVRTVLSQPEAIKKASDRVFDTSGKQVSELLDSVDDPSLRVEEDQDQDIDKRELGGDEAPAVKFVNVMLLKALKEKASDIHIEPNDERLIVRFRVDGRLHEAMPAPKAILPAVTSRIKIMSQLDIAERFAPQDGKFQIRFEGRKIDFRVSILPVVGGEKTVMRILDTGSMALSLDGLGYEDKALSDIQRSIASPYGMLLVTGPTGSGKSTTLYSCVKEVASPEINVVTVEDPVEYRMDGINQVPVNPKRGLTFAGALRSILRQDPDVVLVGEIRDTETADIALKAALTGHLVLSTLHTNDAATTITRLVDMGVDPYMVSSSLLCVGAQRLARRLCSHCRVEIDLPKKSIKEAGFQDGDLDGVQVYGPKEGGCGQCREGYRGRFAILETLFVEPELKRMIVEGRSAQELSTEAQRLGMLTLRRVGLLNVLRGVTSLEEALRVTLDE